MRTNTILLCLGGLALLAGPALAETERLVLAPADTHVSFSLDGNAHDVHGSFHAREGELLFDDETGEASGHLVLDALSGETGNEKRDRKMHRKVLVSDQFPEIALDVTGLRGEVGEGESEVVLLGQITLLGMKHPVELPTHVKRHGDHLEAATAIVVPYVDWGLKDPSFLMFRVAKEVKVDITLEGTLTHG